MLTQALLPSLRAGAPSRVINLSSMAQWIFAPAEGLRWDDLDAKAGYSAWERYGSSKLANLWHAAELQRRYGGEGITALSLHPGVSMETKLMRHSSLGVVLQAMSYSGMWSSMWKDPGKSLTQNSSTSVYAALAPLEGSPQAQGAAGVVRPGAYHRDCAIATEMIHPLAYDAASAARLWEVSEAMVAKALQA